MRVLKRKKSKFLPFIIKSGVCVIIFYFVFLLFNQHMQISEKKFKLKMLSEKIQVQESKNEELRDFSENRDTKNIDYIKQIARESLDLSENNEKVFINVSGN